MYPGFMHWIKETQRQHAERHGRGCETSACCGPGGQWRHAGSTRDSDHGSYQAMEHDGGGSFGVRRPLRFMAHRLALRDEQVSELAAILDELKTERAQAAVDHRRSVGLIADALSGDTFDEQGAKAATGLRVTSAERLRDAVVKALARTHQMLDADQRKQLTYLLRSGLLTI
jgi:Spy/CpxP family protein refolding chaperone